MKKLIVLVVLLTCASGLYSCRMNKGKAGKGYVRRKVEVAVKEVTADDEGVRLGYIGKVAPSRSTTIFPQSIGTLSGLYIRKGQRVAKGDVLARIDSRQAESAWEITRANLMLAQDGYDRAYEVYSSGSITEQKLVEIQSQLAKAQASEKAAAKALDDCIIKAPYDGIINVVHAEPGIEVSPATPLAEILNVNDVEIVFPVPESEIGGIEQGQKCMIDIPAADMSIDAVIGAKGHVASPLSHTYECTVFPERARRMLPGMVCRVYLCSEGPEVISVPAYTVMTDIDGRYVWTVEDGTVRKRYVVVDGYSGDDVIVSEGLDPGDLVITEGRRKVSSGMDVDVIGR